MKNLNILVIAISFIFSATNVAAKSDKELGSYLVQTNADFPPLLRSFPDGKVDAEPRFHEIDGLEELTEKQESQLFDSFRKMPDISGYVYSGCHDRAHAVWQQLDDVQKGQVSKVWLMAPGMTTLAFSDFLTVPSLGDDSPQWGYHVALAYKVNGAIRVIDSVREDWKKNSVSIDEWLGNMNKPYGTFLTFLSPELYLFYSVLDGQSTSGLVSNNFKASVITNGQFFECSGPCRESKNIEIALARDEVGLDLIGGNGCGLLKEVAKQPTDLLAQLNNDTLPEECLSTVEEFNKRIEFWEKALWVE